MSIQCVVHTDTSDSLKSEVHSISPQADTGSVLVKQANFGFIVKLKDVMDIWIYFRIQQIWVYIMEIITQLFSALVRCHVKNLSLRATF